MTLLRTSLLLLAIVLLIVDGWPAIAGTPEVPTDCADEDVPVMDYKTWLDEVFRKITSGK